MKIDLVQTTTRDGVRLDGALQTPVSRSDAALPVDGCCLVHGTGGSFYSSTLFDGLAPHLLAQGCAVLRINTRGHDLMSTASTARGGKRQGAAYEVVDDCRHDLAAWLDWLRERVGQRLLLVGHSLGAVKCLYALSQEPCLPASWVIALSPPRLSYSWFCTSPQGPEFLATYTEAERQVEAGQPAALLDLKLPLPFVVAAGGYVEKYGPEERYNYLRWLAGVPCPMLITFGSIEVENNMAFRGAPEALAELASLKGRLTCQTFPGGDHFYSGVRAELAAGMEAWLRAEVVG
jgi:pimeloyl-ACP methyl ester carboxylesterase